MPDVGYDANNKCENINIKTFFLFFVCKLKSFTISDCRELLTMLIKNDQYRPLFTSLFICQCHTKSLEMDQRGACMFETPVIDSFMLPCDLICGHT